MNEISASDGRIMGRMKRMLNGQNQKRPRKSLESAKINQRLQIVNIEQDRIINIENQDQINNIKFNQIGYQSEQLNNQTIKYSNHQIRSSSNAENRQSEKTHSVNHNQRKPI